MCSSSAPDTSGMNAAAVQQAALSKEQLDWAKKIYAETAPDRAAAITRANAVSDAQLEALKKQTALTDDYADYNKTTFRPLEQGIVDSANGYDTASRRESNAKAAQADVQEGLDNAQGQLSRNLDRRGVNPSSGAALAMSNELAIKKATGLAGAANKARIDTELQGYARKMDAANMGRGLASAQATSAGLAMNAGNSSAANAQAAGNINAQGHQIMTQGYSGAQNGLAGAANTHGNIGRANSGDSSGLGNVVGAGLGYWASTGFAWSDRRLKRDIRLVGRTSGGTSIYAFKYLWADQEVIGVMADEVPCAAIDVGGFKMVDYSKVA